MNRICARLGWALAPPALEPMQAWLHTNRQHSYGRHRYDLADFELGPEQVRERLAANRDRQGYD